TTISFFCKCIASLAALIPSLTMSSVLSNNGTNFGYTPHFNAKLPATFGPVTFAMINELGRTEEISRAVLPVRVETTTALTGNSIVASTAHFAIVLWISVPLNLYSLKLYLVILSTFSQIEVIV